MYSLTKLDYSYDALEPHLDARTLELHHTKHHQTYVTGLNKALGDASYDPDCSADALLHNLAHVPQKIRAAVRFHGGGHANHSFFWQLLTPGGNQGFTGTLSEAINATFGSLDAFKEKFNQVGVGHWGSGWAWLYLRTDRTLAVASTLNHDSPWMRGFVECEGIPVIVTDVWEHAYYLKFQNRRADFMATFWQVINWDQAEKNYQFALQSIGGYYSC